MHASFCALTFPISELIAQKAYANFGRAGEHRLLKWTLCLSDSLKRSRTEVLWLAS